MSFFKKLTSTVKRTVKSVATPQGLAVLALTVATGGIAAGMASGMSFGTAAAGLTSFAAGSTLMAGLTTAAISYGLGAVAQALAPSQDAFDGISVENLGSQGAKFQFRSPVAVREIVYGETRKSGVIVDIDNYGSGTSNLYLHIAISADKTNGITKFFVNDQVVKENVSNTNSGSVSADIETDPDKIDYSSHLQFVYKDGSFPQTPGGTRNDGKTNSIYRYDGISYVRIFLQYNATTYPAGVPNFSFLIKGKSVYDPRTGETEYSNNPALCIRDYLLNQTYGLGCSPEEIDEVSFELAADVCDELNYELNGVVNTSKSPAAIIKDMLTSCAGSIHYSNGKFSMRAAKYVAPTVTIEEKDIISSIKFESGPSTRDLFNQVKAIHYSTGLNQVADIPVENDKEILYRDADHISSVDLSLPFTTNPTRATELAELALYQGQNKKRISFTTNMRHFDLDVGDTVMVNYPRLGITTSDVWEVLSWSFNFTGSDLGIALSLKETSETSYTGVASSGKTIKRLNTKLQIGLDVDLLFDDWSDSTDKVLLIDSDQLIVGDWDSFNAHKAALTINSSLGGTLTIYNRGQIYGVQGIFDDPSSKPADGGDAISIFSSVASSVKIINDGVIAGGGGAGGNGGRSRASEVWDTSGGSNAFKSFGGGGPNDGGDGAGWNGLKVIYPNDATTIGTSGGTSVQTSDPYDYLDQDLNPQQLPAQDVNLYFGADGGDGGGFGEDGESGLTGPTSESQQNGSPDPEGGGPTFGIALKWYPPYGPPQDSQQNDLLGFAPTINAGDGGNAISGGASSEIINRQTIYGSIT